MKSTFEQVTARAGEATYSVPCKGGYALTGSHQWILRHNGSALDVADPFAWRTPTDEDVRRVYKDAADPVGSKGYEPPITISRADLRGMLDSARSLREYGLCKRKGDIGPGDSVVWYPQCGTEIGPSDDREGRSGPALFAAVGYRHGSRVPAILKRIAVGKASDTLRIWCTGAERPVVIHDRAQARTWIVMGARVEDSTQEPSYAAPLRRIERLILDGNEPAEITCEQRRDRAYPQCTYLEIPTVAGAFSAYGDPLAPSRIVYHADAHRSQQITTGTPYWALALDVFAWAMG